MPRIRPELPGQGLLFEVSSLEVSEPVPEIVLAERAAIGRILGAGAMALLNLSPENFKDITQQNLETASATSLERDLYGPGERTISNLALNAIEYGAMIRWTKPLKTAAESKTEERTLETRPDRRKGRILRSGAHSLEQRFEGSENLLQGLSSERLRLIRFQSKLKGYPGWAHMSQAKLLMLYRDVVDFSFINIAEVVAHRRNLELSEAKRLKDSVLYLATSTPRKTRKQYLEDMTDLSIRYSDKRSRLFKNKLKIAQTAVDDSYKAARKVDDSK